MVHFPNPPRAVTQITVAARSLHHSGFNHPREQTMSNNETEAKLNDVNRALTDAELDAVPGAGFPYFNSDSAVYQTVMMAAAYAYREAQYFGR